MLAPGCQCAVGEKTSHQKQRQKMGTSLVAQWLRLCAPGAGGMGLIPGQGTRSHMPQLRVYMFQVIRSHMLHLWITLAIMNIEDFMCCS